ncbi:hypothetical protein RvY_00704 [Ramazzottius varieornatus]|uniref:BTB domain-containing protein n=1 Tax=Ramazzottius varieornatus TaxID=947166 RepID=A0A1D1UP27_RAMVA|nr:hypothetical protein RvY_00704 [Ramazzottius varieornatus]
MALAKAEMDKNETIGTDQIQVTLKAASTGALLTMKIVWKIDFFSFRQHLTVPMASPAIKCSDLGVSEIDGDWCLVLIPKIMSKRENEEKEREFVSLHLRRETKGGDVPTRFWLRIMDAKNNCVYRRDCLKPVIFAPKSTGSAMWGWDRYISHEDLFLPKNNYLTDDSLILEAQIQCLASTKLVEDTMMPNTNSREVNLLTEHMGQMYRAKEFTDFTLVACDGRELKAHRAVLAARSEVFRSMVTYDTKESANRRCEIDDTDGETLDHVLSYMYGLDLEQLADTESVKKVLVAADKYCLKGLVEACETLLISKITAETAGNLLTMADRHNAASLKVACFKFILSHMSEVTNCGGMTEIAKYENGNKNGLMNEMMLRVGHLGRPQGYNKDTPSKMKY